MTPDREPRREQFRDSEDLTLLGLGALSWLDRFAQALEPRAVAEVDAPEALIAAALGLLSLRRTLRRWGDQAADAPEPSTPPHAASLDGLMR